jgi:hypothetical protein
MYQLIYLDGEKLPDQSILPLIQFDLFKKKMLESYFGFFIVSLYMYSAWSKFEENSPLINRWIVYALLLLYTVICVFLEYRILRKLKIIIKAPD